ncbi:hypothetical protein OG478_13835 [Streptomyces phaeochromogenes]|uniref:hypothetical protein n=1 Tax=Streptomyces phaeochromogenes TaxID=1923 RepID=UPI0038686424|nr:hypothetical protein OG478_13835 [Streptomyces phaeochromogenes]
MSTTPPDAVQVQITPDGICFIDEEFVTPPPGTSLNEAVIAYLQLEAAALEMPIRAVIQDEQANYTTSIQVNADGTSHTLDNGAQVPTSPNVPQATAIAPSPSIPAPNTPDAVPPSRPHEPLPEPYRGRLVSICATANKNHFAEAVRAADQLLAELSTHFGPSHLYTLAVGLVRADIAWLTQDFRFGLRAWTFMAQSWHVRLGPQHSVTVLAVGNAIGCWRRLQPADAKASAPHILSLLQDVSIPDSDTAVLAINRQTQRIALVNERLNRDN